MALGTFDALNRCLPEIIYNHSVGTFCEYPSCTQAAEPVQTVAAELVPLAHMTQNGVATMDSHCERGQG